ncbi:MAG: molybdopterin dinucleotide binding domain-containing protein [Promethearchaeota archaeon]
MRIKAFEVKTATINSGSENGKFSEAYEDEALSCFMNPEDVKSFGFKEGMNVSCMNPESEKKVVFTLKPSRFVKPGTVVINKSLFTAGLNVGESRTFFVELEKTTERTLQLNEIINKIKSRK